MKLQNLCDVSNPRIRTPFVIRRGAKPWTVATNGRCLVLERGRHTRRVATPRILAAYRAAFLRTRSKLLATPGWKTPADTDWKALAKFIRARRTRTVRGTEPVQIFGVYLDARLLRPYAMGRKAERVVVRASKEWIDRYGVRFPASIRIDAPDWSIVCMALLVSESEASFP